MTTQTTTDGAARALAVLCEANDLLNVLREQNGESLAMADGKILSGRLNRAIEYLDGAVPHPEDSDNPAA